METIRFVKLLTNGFDIEFNINNVFFSFTTAKKDGKTIYCIGNENKTINALLYSIDELLNYVIDGEKVSAIVQKTPEEEVYY